MAVCGANQLLAPSTRNGPSSNARSVVGRFSFRGAVANYTEATEIVRRPLPRDNFLSAIVSARTE